MGLLLTEVTWDGPTAGKPGRKTGEACAKSYLSLIASGDASVAAAARAGKITNVTSIDHRTKWLLVYGEYCTIVRGT